MIGISNQYACFFSIDKFKDFIQEADLDSFTIIEDAGNVLPTFELSFTLQNHEVLKVLNEGNTLQASMGVTSNDFETFKLRILKKRIVKQGDSSYFIKLLGVYDAPSYVSNSKIRSSKEMSGVELIKAYISEYFTPVFNINKSDDKQKWLQYNIADKVHINNVWMHSFLKDSFIAIGISSNGQFILKDVRKEVQTKPKWTFSSHSSEGAIVYEPEYYIESDTGFINQWVGYERNKTLFQQDEGIYSSANPNINPMLTLTNKFDRADIKSNRIDEVGVINDNMHENYWNAYLNNITNLSLFSTTKITLSFADIYKPIKVLDLVSMRDLEINNKESTEYYSGLYLVSKVARTLSKRRLSTVLVLNRESLGSNSGEFK